MRVLAIMLALALMSCGSESVLIDGSSPEAFASTTKAARRQIPDGDRLAFDRAIRTIGGRRHANNDPDALARVTFDGMTAQQIVADQRAREAIRGSI